MLRWLQKKLGITDPRNRSQLLRQIVGRGGGRSKATLAKTGLPRSFSTVRNRVFDFMTFKPKLYQELVFGAVLVYDVIDYSDKVHQLDPTYVIDPAEISNRQIKYQAYLQREAAASRERQRAKERMNRTSWSRQ